MTGGDAAMVRQRFGIEANGNAPQDPQGEFTGRNLLYIARTVDEIAIRSGAPSEAVVEALGRARAAARRRPGAAAAAARSTTRSSPRGTA